MDVPFSYRGAVNVTQLATPHVVILHCVMPQRIPPTPVQHVHQCYKPPQAVPYSTIQRTKLQSNWNWEVQVALWEMCVGPQGAHVGSKGES